MNRDQFIGGGVTMTVPRIGLLPVSVSSHLCFPPSMSLLVTMRGSLRLRLPGGERVCPNGGPAALPGSILPLSKRAALPTPDSHGKLRIGTLLFMRSSLVLVELKSV